MDVEQERLFIQSFVLRERRERAAFELASPKRRPAFLNRLCHTYAAVLDMRYAQALPASLADWQAVLAILLAKHALPMCYAISMSDALDGKHMPLEQVLQGAVSFGLPSIVICIPGKLAYFEAEQEHGPPPRFLLER
ncbi:MAG: hypothetical protein MUD01_14415 [Chloroflexaceae bacterium]|jgi:hypothetical protein|nr:hypothetical protein [Chloroflexaceae bacterium]